MCLSLWRPTPRIGTPPLGVPGPQALAPGCVSGLPRVPPAEAPLFPRSWVPFEHRLQLFKPLTRPLSQGLCEATQYLLTALPLFGPSRFSLNFLKYAFL